MLWPKLSTRQRDVVSEVVRGFGASRSPAAERLLLLYLRNARANPTTVGLDLSQTACGCDRGFRVQSLNPFTVVRCRVCSEPELVDLLPHHPYQD